MQNKLHKYIAYILSFIICINTVYAKSGTENIKATYRNIKVNYNNKVQLLSIEPFIVNGSVYVPLRTFSQIMNANVLWIPETNMVQIVKNETDNSTYINEINDLKQTITGLEQTISSKDEEIRDILSELQQVKEQLKDQNESNVGNIGDTTVNDKYSFEEQVLQLVNKERTANGLKRLTLNTDLRRMARIKSTDMYENNYFSHESPTYGSPFDMLDYFGYRYKRASENIAKGQRTPEEVMNSWMNSTGHRQNILDPYVTKIGIGYEPNGNIWTQIFSD